MFSKLKSSSGSPTSSNSLLELNPISQYFEFGKQIGSAGPELVWKIYEAVRKSDRKVNIVCSAAALALYYVWPLVFTFLCVCVCVFAQLSKYRRYHFFTY